MMSSEAKITHDQRSTATLPTGVAPSLGSRPQVSTAPTLQICTTASWAGEWVLYRQTFPYARLHSSPGVNHRITANTALQLAASAL